MMSLEEYTEKVCDGMRRSLKGLSRREIELYLVKLKVSGYIKRNYDEDVLDFKNGRTKSIDPIANGYCYVLTLDYPTLY